MSVGTTGLTIPNLICKQLQKFVCCENEMKKYLATGLSFRSIAYCFRIGVSTVSKIISETVVALWETLQPIHMPVPSVNMLKAIADDFYKIWNFPHVLGAIDGKHIRVLCPKNSGSMYYNYKKYFSIVLQGISDANYKFVTIDVGGYGKQSDGGTFQASDFYKAIITKDLEIPNPTCLPETTIKAPFVFIEDEAYPLMDWLLKPYSARNDINFEEEYFNKRLSRARKTVECCFGIMTSKWRILTKSIDTDVNLADKIIKSICVLHNTIIDREGFERHSSEVTEEFDKQTFSQAAIGRPLNSAKTIRDIFTLYFKNNPISYV